MLACASCKAGSSSGKFARTGSRPNEATAELCLRLADPDGERRLRDGARLRGAAEMAKPGQAPRQRSCRKEMMAISLTYHMSYLN